MTQPETSNAPSMVAPTEGPQPFYTLLEFTYLGGTLMTVSLIQWADDARAAAERSAGFQLGEGCAPRRILVYEGAPTTFEWRQVRPYVLELGKEWPK